MTRLALVLGGGGARGAYQAGVLRSILRRHPHLDLPVLNGISAGAINVTFLAGHTGDWGSASEALARLWLSLPPDQVFRLDAPSLAANVLRWGWRLVSGGVAGSEHPKALLDTDPLRAFLSRHLDDGAEISRKIASGRVHAVSVSATSYRTGRSVTWTQGRDIDGWERPHRHAESAVIDVDRVMASAALPLLFPAVRVGFDWFGDGGIRLTAPLAPALHLGATHILTISTRAHAHTEARPTSTIVEYPSPAQILGVLHRAVFLDVLDDDLARLEMINQLLATARRRRHAELRTVHALVLRPSRDLGLIARAFEPQLPAPLRFLTRGLGTQRPGTADVLSLLMFGPGYLAEVVHAGEEDAEQQRDRIDEFLERAERDAPTRRALGTLRSSDRSRITSASPVAHADASAGV